MTVIILSSNEIKVEFKIKAIAHDFYFEKNLKISRLKFSTSENFFFRKYFLNMAEKNYFP